MDVRNCKGCGRLFNYMSGAPFCEGCKKKLEEKFQDVKKYLNENPLATINEVSEVMEVSVKQLRQWIKEERLSVTVAGADGINCEQCGAPICSGRFCNRCKAAMLNNLNGAIAKPKVEAPKKTEEKGNKMRFLY